MSFLLALLIGGAGLAWVWGAMTGRLPAMLAGLLEPARPGKTGAWLIEASSLGTGPKPAQPAASGKTPVGAYQKEVSTTNQLLHDLGL